MDKKEPSGKGVLAEYRVLRKGEVKERIADYEKLQERFKQPPDSLGPKADGSKDEVFGVQSPTGINEIDKLEERGNQVSQDSNVSEGATLPQEKPPETAVIPGGNTKILIEKFKENSEKQIEQERTQQIEEHERHLKDNLVKEEVKPKPEKKIIDSVIQTFDDLQSGVLQNIADAYILPAEERRELLREKAENALAYLGEVANHILTTYIKSKGLPAQQEQSENDLEQEKENILEKKKPYKQFFHKQQQPTRRTTLERLTNFVDQLDLSQEDKDTIKDLLAKNKELNHIPKDLSLQPSEEHREYMKSAATDGIVTTTLSQDDFNNLSPEDKKQIMLEQQSVLPEHREYYMTIAPEPDIEEGIDPKRVQHEKELEDFLDKYQWTEPPTQAKTLEELYLELKSRGFRKERINALLKEAISTQELERKFDELVEKEPENLRKIEEDFKVDNPSRPALDSRVNSMETPSKEQREQNEFSYENIKDLKILAEMIRHVNGLKEKDISAEKWAEQFQRIITEANEFRPKGRRVTTAEQTVFLGVKRSCFKGNTSNLLANRQHKKENKRPQSKD